MSLFYADAQEWLWIGRVLPAEWERANGFDRFQHELAKMLAAGELDAWDEMASELATVRDRKRTEQGFFIQKDEWLAAVESFPIMRPSPTGFFQAYHAGRVLQVGPMQDIWQALVEGEWEDAFWYKDDRGIVEFEKADNHGVIGDLARQLAAKLRADVVDDFMML